MLKHNLRNTEKKNDLYLKKIAQIRAELGYMSKADRAFYAKKNV